MPASVRLHDRRRDSDVPDAELDGFTKRLHYLAANVAFDPSKNNVTFSSARSAMRRPLSRERSRCRGSRLSRRRVLPTTGSACLSWSSRPAPRSMRPS